MIGSGFVKVMAGGTPANPAMPVKWGPRGPSGG